MKTLDATTVPNWPALAAALADELTRSGKLRSPAWRAALEAVPRHLFVPRFYVRRDGRMVAVTAGDAEWQAQVWANAALVTKIDEEDGLPEFLSSSSMPGLMTRMLEELDVRGDERVLEIGTGTGYNAALLSHRLGGEQVFSIDIEPDLVAAARDRLAAIGLAPTLVVGDGAAGSPAHAPFDRIIATCSVPAIPWPWIEQTRVGGIVLADVRVGVAAGNLVRLTRIAPERAEGMFDAGQASFMGLRHAAGSTGRIPYVRAPDDTLAIESMTELDPRTPWTVPVAWFLAASSIGGHYRLGYTGGDPEHGPEGVSITAPDGSRAEVSLAPDRGGHRVRETGPVRLWAKLEEAHRRWSRAGEPGWSRLGLAVTPENQTIFVDERGHDIAVLTRRHRTS